MHRLRQNRGPAELRQRPLHLEDDIGICQDRRVDFVYATEHAEALQDLEAATRERDALHRLVRRLAFTNPREGEWERSYRMLQREARAVLSRTGETR